MGLGSFLVEQFYSNQFMTAAVVAAPMTALVYTARNLPLRLWAIAKRAATIEVGFNSDIPDYLSAQSFVAEQVVKEYFSRTFLYSSTSKWYGGDETVDHKGLTLGYGPHVGTWQRRLVWIDRSLENGQQTDKFKERLTITFLTRNRKVVKDFADQVRQYSDSSSVRDHIPLLINNDGWWRTVGKMPKRSISTVFTANGEADRLIAHLRDFEGRKDWYRQRGLPWHTGVLLTGKPGTGKTSLIHAVASEMGRSIHYLNLGSVTNDKQLTELVSNGRGWERTILVVEDADAAGADLNREGAAGDGERKPLTLSAVLNVLDGLITPDGLMVIATSNHPERLDKALVRAGRFDLCMDIGDLDWPAFVRMANVFGFDLSPTDHRRASYRPQAGAVLRARLLEEGLDGVIGAREAA